MFDKMLHGMLYMSRGNKYLVKKQDRENRTLSAIYHINTLKQASLATPRAALACENNLLELWEQITYLLKVNDSSYKLYNLLNQHISTCLFAQK